MREVRPDDDADDDLSDERWEPEVSERRPRAPAEKHLLHIIIFTSDVYYTESEPSLLATSTA